MLLNTDHFGQIEIAEDEIIEIPRSLLGFEGLQRYVIVDRDESKPFRWLQSIDEPTLAFVIANPLIFFPDYRVEVNSREVADIEVDDPTNVEILVIVTIPTDLENMSVNLQGPILLNRENNMAKQIVLTESTYAVKHYIMKELQRRTAEPADVNAAAMQVTE